MTSILSQIIEILVGGLTSFGTGIGNGIQSIVQSLFVSVDTTTGAQSLTIFGMLIVTFAAISLAVGITRRLFSWVTTLGGSK